MPTKKKKTTRKKVVKKKLTYKKRNCKELVSSKAYEIGHRDGWNDCQHSFTKQTKH